MSAKRNEPRQYENVDASPVKSFFVTMLTRDISLSDAILDLLDNCVDGILRKKKRATGKTPYNGFFAEIKFDSDTFEIHDNCGGIPWSLHDYAFRMGRPRDRQDRRMGTVGTYGIGMKRAIFKIGRECLISTKCDDDNYEVEISPKWLDEEGNWDIPVEPARESMTEDGTTIVVGMLHSDIKSRLGHDVASFEAELTRKIETHYAFIIAKGFRVLVNGNPVTAKPTQLVFYEGPKKKGIRPYLFKAKVEGVEVFLAVGFTRPIPSQQEVLDDQEVARYSSLDAGWTVVCNDRAILYCDRTEVTGWGEAGVPQYHQQFIAISGLVEFRSDDPAKLPTTTTKRGIDASSRLYLQVKNRMREGMKIFTDYTNKWKTNVRVSKTHISEGTRLSFSDVKAKTRNLSFRKVKKGVGGELYKPVLPMPEPKTTTRTRISFSKEVVDVETVSEHLFGRPGVKPDKVGEKCFDQVLREARK